MVQVFVWLETQVTMGIPSVEGHARQTNDILWYKIFLWVSDGWYNTIPLVLGRGDVSTHQKSSQMEPIMAWSGPLVRMGISDVEGNARANHCCPVVQHILYGSQMDDFCMVGDTSQHGDTWCWGSCKTNQYYLVMQHTLSGLMGVEGWVRQIISIRWWNYHKITITLWCY